MDLDFSKISRIKKIRAEKSRLSEEESVLSIPVIENRSYIKRIKELFKDIISEIRCPVTDITVSDRKKLIIIILYLYSPSTLAGGKMPKNLREDINKALGIHSKSVVSNNFSDVTFLYEHYADFKNDVDYIFNRLYTKLLDEGLAKIEGG